MYDENYQKRITNSTPENIRIRSFYNQLNNRPLNYGMEDLFPNMDQYTNQPLMSMDQLNNAPSQISGFTMPQKKDFHLADMPPLDIDWKRLGKAFNDEFATDANLIRLGAENYINKISKNKYAEYVPNYIDRKNDYYNSFSDQWKDVAIRADETMDFIIDAKKKYNLLKSIYKIFYKK